MRDIHIEKTENGYIVISNLGAAYPDKQIATSISAVLNIVEEILTGEKDESPSQ